MNWSYFEQMNHYVPFDLATKSNFGIAFVVLLGVIFIRYLMFVIPALVLFYSKWGQKKFSKMKIYPRLPTKTQQWQEFRWSLLSAVVFAVSGVILGLLWQKGMTQIFLNKNDVTPIYFWILAPFFVIVFHDAYFYWTHRWLHRPRIFKKFHEVHHRFLEPSPWASFAFHPVESVINALAVPLICLVLPLHPVHILFHLTIMTMSAISNHLGYEILPEAAKRLGIHRWFISGFHHSQHHRFFRTNFGLFFSAWDQIMRTEKKVSASVLRPPS